MLDLHGETRIRIDPISLERPKTSKFKAQRLGSLSVPVCPQLRRCTLLPKKEQPIFAKSCSVADIIYFYRAKDQTTPFRTTCSNYYVFGMINDCSCNPCSQKKPNISLLVGFKCAFGFFGFPVVCRRGLGFLLAVPLPIHGDRTCCPTTTLVKYCFS